MPRTLFEYVGGPLDGARPDVDTAPVLLHDGGTYTAAPVRRIIGADGVERRPLDWTPTPGGRRNRPACDEPCGRGCPAYRPTP